MQLVVMGLQVRETHMKVFFETSKYESFSHALNAVSRLK